MLVVNLVKLARSNLDIVISGPFIKKVSNLYPTTYKNVFKIQGKPRSNFLVRQNKTVFKYERNSDHTNLIIKSKELIKLQ